MLSAALVARLLRDVPSLQIELVAIEVDESLEELLIETLDDCLQTAEYLGTSLSYTSIIGDFLELSILGNETCSGVLDQPFDIVIMNPPYRKISRNSPEGMLLSSAQRYTPNMYASFILFALDYLAPGGQIVSINPRSFANGTYFANFRMEFNHRVALDHLHLFDSRTAVFSDSNVLQETVVICGTLEGVKGKVVISTSHGDAMMGSTRIVEYEDVVSSSDPYGYVRIAASEEEIHAVEVLSSLSGRLGSIDVSVSTGKVVDFRNWPRIFPKDVPQSIPLVYPQNLTQGKIQWPILGRKQQWLKNSAEDANLALPEGTYVVVKRFTAKEEPRRIVAGIWEPKICEGPVAFENHLNVVNLRGGGLDHDFAVGLCLWLNSSIVDSYFRTISGSTQANASDLIAIPYPEFGDLQRLGQSYPDTSMPKQKEIDEIVAPLYRNDCGATRIGPDRQLSR